MEGVSGRAVVFALDGVRERGIDPESLLEGLDVTIDEASKRSYRMPWDTFAQLVSRLGKALGGPEGLREFGRASSVTPTMDIFRRVGRALSHPDDVYRMGVRWMGPALFPMIDGRIEELPDGRLRQTLTIAPNLSDCPELFYIMEGAFVALPQSYGHGESEVELEVLPRQGIFTIQPQTTSSGWLGRSIRSIHRRLSFRAMLREIESQQDALRETYWEIRSARDRIEAQATELERVNSIGRQLSEHIELERVADVLVETMIGEFDLIGVELRLIPPDTARTSEPRFYRRAGRVEGSATDRYSLASAGRPVGALDVWRTAPTDARETPSSAQGALFERLLPWIAMALDNALIHAELQGHASDLEHRVKERTARLLATNHHLVREIDERKRATDALLESEAQLRASERLASVGTLAAGIAHEINNPIGSILAAAQFAQVLEHDEDGRGDRAAISRALADIVTQAKRCGGIVRSVLQFSRDERTEKWDCPLQDIVRRSARLYQASTAEELPELDLQLPERPIWVHVNPIQIEQAVVNLLHNALEAGSSRVCLRAAARADESQAIVVVSDDGPGIPSDDRLRIFEPFYTTKRDEGGTGLGLSVVHGIAAEHRGDLKIEASDDGGVSAILELPTIPAPAIEIDDKSE